jgi:hypothetical protein
MTDSRSRRSRPAAYLAPMPTVFVPTPRAVQPARVAATLDVPPPAPASATPVERIEPEAATHDPSGRWPRRPRPALDNRAHALVIGMQRIDEPIRGLARRFPHVLNRIAHAWVVPPAAAEIIDELLVDRRGGRRGFPADVLAELLLLRRHCRRRMVRAAQDGSVGLARSAPNAG